MDIRLEPRSAVVFDLDDTLYLERDYVRSGFNAVTTVVASAYKIDIGERLWGAYEGGSHDAIGDVCAEFGLPASLKTELLQVYRFHSPTIALCPGAQSLLEVLTGLGVPLALITDGRSLSQRLKISALGIRDFFSFISVSADIGFEKPHPRAFELVMERLSAENYFYIGDNPRKDFLVPRQLGWQTIGIDAGVDRVHPFAILGAEFQPDFWVRSLNSIHFVL